MPDFCGSLIGREPVFIVSSVQSATFRLIILLPQNDGFGKSITFHETQIDIARSVEVPGACNQTFNVGADQPYTVNQLARADKNEYHPINPCKH